MSEAKITQGRSAFSLACGVEVNIRAGAEKVWGILTNAKDFPPLEFHRYEHSGGDSRGTAD